MSERKKLGRWGRKEWQEMRRLCVEIPLMERRLADLGLFETMHAMNDATKKLGYEIERRIRKGYTS